MIFEKPPKAFKPKTEAAGCFIECRGKILMLHRAKGETEGNTWGIPGGKVEAGETVKEGVLREIKEETGITVSGDAIVFLKKIYVRYTTHDFIYDMFYAELKEFLPVLTNAREHIGHLWLTPEDALKLNLITDGKECIEYFMSVISSIKSRK